MCKQANNLAKLCNVLSKHDRYEGSNMVRMEEEKEDQILLGFLPHIFLFCLVNYWIKNVHYVIEKMGKVTKH